MFCTQLAVFLIHVFVLGPSFKQGNTLSLSLPNCTVDGSVYRIGQTIKYGLDEFRCSYSIVCSGNNRTSLLRQPNCPPTTTTTTTLGPPSGYCIYKGKQYSPGTMIEEGQSGTWCYSTRCDWSGQIVHGDDFNCSIPPTTPTTVIPAAVVG